MGLVVCVDCDGKVSDEASTCPHCGKPAPVDTETIEALRKEAEKREAEELARRQFAEQTVRREAERKASVTGINLRYACSIAGIVVVVVGTVAVSAGRILHFPSFSFDTDGPRIFNFLYWLILAIVPFSLASGLPLLANLRMPKAKVFCIIGLLGALFAFLLSVLNSSFFDLIIPLSSYEYDFGNHWWIAGNFNQWCWQGSAFAFLVSLLCLSATCLCFRNKVLGFVALPFILLHALSFLLLLIQIHSDQNFHEWRWILDTCSFVAVVVLCSVATMLDEKQRLGEVAGQRS